MNNLQKLVWIVGAGLTLASCREYYTEYSLIKNEDAMVTGKKYFQKNVDSVTNINRIEFTEIGGEIKSEEKIMVHSKITPEKYRITFRGRIEFNVDNKDIFDRFELNDFAKVSYIDRYKLIYDDTNKDGTNELVSKKFEGFIFMDAQPITN